MARWLRPSGWVTHMCTKTSSTEIPQALALLSQKYAQKIVFRCFASCLVAVTKLPGLRSGALAQGQGRRRKGANS